jgi:hypothetical protein
VACQRKSVGWQWEKPRKLKEYAVAERSKCGSVVRPNPEDYTLRSDHQKEHTDKLPNDFSCPNINFG